MLDFYIRTHPIFNAINSEYGALTSIAMSFNRLNDFFNSVGDFFTGTFNAINVFFRNLRGNWQVVIVCGVAVVAMFSLIRK